MSDALAAFPPSIARLVTHHGVRLLDAEEALGSGHALVLCPGDARRVPESSDVAVVLPELCAAFAGRVSPGLATPVLEARLRARHGVRIEPALLVFRDGAYVSAITGMRDWSVFVAELSHALAQEPAPVRVGLPMLDASGNDGGSRCG